MNERDTRLETLESQHDRKITTKFLYSILDHVKALLRARDEYDESGDSCLHQDVSDNDLRNLIRYIQKGMR